MGKLPFAHLKSSKSNSPLDKFRDHPSPRSSEKSTLAEPDATDRSDSILSIRICNSSSVQNNLPPKSVTFKISSKPFPTKANLSTPIRISLISVISTDMLLIFAWTPSNSNPSAGNSSSDKNFSQLPPSGRAS